MRDCYVTGVLDHAKVRWQRYEGVKILPPMAQPLEVADGRPPAPVRSSQRLWRNCDADAIDDPNACEIREQRARIS
jgi:hypothetical protein